MPSSPDEPSKGMKLSCTWERQCCFFTAVLDMANELERRREKILSFLSVFQMLSL